MTRRPRYSARERKALNLIGGLLSSCQITWETAMQLREHVLKGGDFRVGRGQ